MSGDIKQYDEQYLKEVPAQQRSKETLAIIVRAAETLLADENINRDGFTIQLVFEEIVRCSSNPNIAIGTIYRYFENRVSLLNYIWPNRKDTIFKKTNGSS